MKWRYEVVVIGDGQLEESLEYHGQKEWELVTATFEKGLCPEHDRWRLIFKRPESGNGH